MGGRNFPGRPLAVPVNPFGARFYVTADFSAGSCHERRLESVALIFVILRAGRPQDSRRDAGATETTRLLAESICAARHMPHAHHNAFLGGADLLPLLQFLWFVAERVGC
jgi:hypothetical protein